MGKLHQDHQTRVTILVVDCIILYHIVSHIIDLDDGKIYTGNPNILYLMGIKKKNIWFPVKINPNIYIYIFDGQKPWFPV